MTASEHDRRRGRSAIAVELSIADLDLADHVRAVIAEQPGIDIVGTDARKAQVLVTDGAIDLAHNVAVLVLTDRRGAMESLRAGAAAVLSERIDGDSLAAAIRAAAQGLTTLSAEFRDQLIDSPISRDGLASEAEDERPAIQLTTRELQVLQLLAEGASNKSIARRLDITPHTAKFHVASIVAKLGATGRTDAVARAMRLGLIMI